MTRKHRLARERDFQRVFQKSRRWSNSYLTLRALANEYGFSRYGFVVSKALGGAVVRNKVKRRLREITRRLTIQEGWDLVFIAKKGAAEANFSQLVRSAECLVQKASLLKRPVDAPSGGCH